MNIQEANELTLRPAMKTIVQVDIPKAEIHSIQTQGAYYTGPLGTAQAMPTYMDFADGGFANDGMAKPLADDDAGIVSEIGENTSITITMDNVVRENVDLWMYDGGELVKRSYTVSGTAVTIILPATTQRRIITDIVIGRAWIFDNSTLVSVNGVLRGVETKVENPELQASEIEVKGYEPNDITDMIGKIGTDYPIYYTCGYYGDMAPVRKFYLSDMIEWEDSVITFKGSDATRFLDDEYAVYVGNTSGHNGGINRYISQIHTMLNNSNVVHEYQNDYNVSPYTNGSSFLIPKISKRQVISQAINLFRFIGYDDEELLPIYINYVDAGIPKLWTGKSDIIKEIKHISKPQVSVEPVIGTIKMNNFEVDGGMSKTIETVSLEGSTIREVSEPYYSFSTSAGTITKISPYVYKLVRNGSATISGVPLRTYDPTAEGEFTPIVVNGSDGGTIVTLDDLTGLIDTAGDGVIVNELMDLSLKTMLNRSNILYEFEYRGDPRLQPRDYIKADVDGSGTLTNMTIESIEFNHEGGGYKQKIVARKGLI